MTGRTPVPLSGVLGWSTNYTETHQTPGQTIRALALCALGAVPCDLELLSEQI